MLENGVKILGLDIIEDLDGLYFPVETVAEGTKRVSWDALKEDLFGDYLSSVAVNGAGTAHYLRFANKYTGEVASTIESYSDQHEATFTNKVEKNGGVNILDITMQDYDEGEMRVIFNSQAEGTAGNLAGFWFYSTDSRDGGAGIQLLAHLGPNLGEWEIRGSFYPFEDDTQDIGSADLTWSNAYIGYVKASAVKVTGSYRFDDGVTVFTGATGTFTTANGKTVTVKGGIITAIV